MVNCKGEVKLSDFGTAKSISSTLRSSAGTIAWMSPEMYKGLKYDRFSDIWSLGCTIYEMFYGKPPFYKNAKILANYEVEMLNFPKMRSISEEAKHFIKACLQNKPQDRPNVYQLRKHPFIKDVVIDIKKSFANCEDLNSFISIQSKIQSNLQSSIRYKFKKKAFP